MKISKACDELCFAILACAIWIFTIFCFFAIDAILVGRIIALTIWKSRLLRGGKS